jgi:hypothetical protein
VAASIVPAFVVKKPTVTLNGINTVELIVLGSRIHSVVLAARQLGCPLGESQFKKAVGFGTFTAPSTQQELHVHRQIGIRSK